MHPILLIIISTTMLTKLLFHKNVDKSLLQKGGLTIPVDSINDILAHFGKSLNKGKSENIKIEIEGKLYNCKLTIPNIKDKKQDTLQIRYTGKQPIARKLQSMFPDIYNCVIQGKNIPDDIKQTIAFGLTDEAGVFCFEKDNNTMTREELKEGFRRYLKRIGLDISKSYPTNIDKSYVKEAVKNKYGLESVYDLDSKEKIMEIYEIVKGTLEDKKCHGQGSCAVKKYASYYLSITKNKVNSLSDEEIELCSDNLKYLIAAKAKPFLIFGGFSGTGKSQKVKELAYLTCPKLDDLQNGNDPGNYALISVKPNWHDSTELLGYYSTIGQKYVCTDFMRFLVKAMKYPDIPFFVCLDEMNLAPVEEYLAEYLSVLESRKNVDGAIISSPLISAGIFNTSYQVDIFKELGIPSDGDQEEENSIIIEQLQQDGLTLPQNVIVIGTVNMDDTTNSFSRKVIDRAITFETEIEKFTVDGYFEQVDTLRYGNLDSSRFICDKVKASDVITEEPNLLSDTDKEIIINFMNDINERMSNSPFQVSYRVLNEIILYYRALKKLTPDDASLEKVLCTILLTKVLPRIEGDSDRVKKPLEGLRDYVDTCTNKALWKPVADKINYMLKPFENAIDGFTRFWI